MRKGPREIDDWPQAGQRKRTERDKTVRIDALVAVILAQYSHKLPDNLSHSFRQITPELTWVVRLRLQLELPQVQEKWKA